MEKDKSDCRYEWPRIKEPTGGLAEISAVRSGKGRLTIRLGEERLGDVVTSGKKKLLEFKGRSRRPVLVPLQALREVLSRLETERE